MPTKPKAKPDKPKISKTAPRVEAFEAIYITHPTHKTFSAVLLRVPRAKITCVMWCKGGRFYAWDELKSVPTDKAIAYAKANLKSKPSIFQR